MSDEPIPGDFIELCRDRLLRQRGDAEVAVDGERLWVVIPGEAPRGVGLRNVWRSIGADRDTPPRVGLVGNVRETDGSSVHVGRRARVG